MSNPNSFVQGKTSKLDIALYGIQTLGTPITGDTDLLAVDIGTSGKQRTNLPIKNTMPSNWDVFNVEAIAVKFLSEQKLADIITVTNDAFFSFKVADYEYKFGHLSELVFPSSFYATNSSNVATYQTDSRVGAFVPLKQSVEINPTMAMNFVVTFKTNAAALQATLLGVWLKGTLSKLIAG